METTNVRGIVTIHFLIIIKASIKWVLDESSLTKLVFLCILGIFRDKKLVYASKFLCWNCKSPYYCMVPFLYLGCGLWPPKVSFGDLLTPMNCLCLSEKGTQFGMNYPAVRLCVAEYWCPYHSVVGSIYDPAHCSMTQIICLPTLLNLCRNKRKNPCPGSQFKINVDHK